MSFVATAVELDVFCIYEELFNDREEKKLRREERRMGKGTGRDREEEEGGEGGDEKEEWRKVPVGC